MSKAVKFLIGTTALLGVMCVVMGINATRPTEAEKAKRELEAKIRYNRALKVQKCNNAYDEVSEAAKSAIKTRLKDPYTAKFEFVTVAVGEGIVQVEYIVQSKNGFGLYVTNVFLVNYKQLEDPDCAFIVEPMPTKIFTEK